MRFPVHPSILALALLIFSACQKTHLDNNNDSASPEDSIKNEDFGYLYYNNGNGEFVQFNLNTEKEGRRISTSAEGFGLSPFSGRSTSDSGKIYFSSVYSVTCMDAATGNVVWSQNLMSGGFQKAPISVLNYPIIVDSIIYTISYGGTGHSLNALNKYTGKILWRVDIARNMEWSGRFYGFPVVYKDKIYALCPEGVNEKQNITCCNRFTGERIWEATNFRDDLESFPIIANNSRLLVFSTGNTYVASYDLETGNLEYYTKFESPYPFGARVHVINGNIYTTASEHLLKIDIENKKATSNDDGMYLEYSFNDDYYVRGGTGFSIVRRDVETSAPKWNWDSPYADTLSKIALNGDVRPDGSLYHYLYHPMYVTDKYVYWINAASKFSTVDLTTINVVNSIFILNKQTGKLIKEIKMPTDAKHTINPYIFYFSAPELRPSQYYP